MPTSIAPSRKPSGGVLRRLLVPALAATLAAPILAITPASATVLFSCTGGQGNLYLTPGLGQTPTHQTDVSPNPLSLTSCSNGDEASIAAGSQGGQNTIASVANPNGDLACGSDPADNTPLLVGLTDPSFVAGWFLGGSSSGITKIKSSGIVERWKVVLVITAGKYAPPAGLKTKIKATFEYFHLNGNCSDGDRSTQLQFFLSGSAIVQQV